MKSDQTAEWRRFGGTHEYFVDNELAARVGGGRVRLILIRPRDHTGLRPELLKFACMVDGLAAAKEVAVRELEEEEDRLRQAVGMPRPEHRAPHGCLR